MSSYEMNPQSTNCCSWIGNNASQTLLCCPSSTAIYSIMFNHIKSKSYPVVMDNCYMQPRHDGQRQQGTAEHQSKWRCHSYLDKNAMTILLSL